MPSEQAKMDDNYRRALIAVTDDVNAFLKNLLVDPTTGRLKVTAIVTSGGGITSLNALTGGSQTFADVDDTNVTLTIASVGTTHTFTIGWSGQLAIARGGTGGATAQAGFDALAPTTTEGDIIFRNATVNTRLAKGTAGQVLTMNAGATAPEWQTPTAAPTNFADNVFYVSDNGDSTKRVAFQVSGVTTSTTRTLTVQDADGTIYITGGTDVAVADGGTGASTALDARTNLGLAIGTNVQAYSALLAAIAGMTPTDGNIIVGDGATFVAESGATARTSLGLGTGDSPTFTAVSADTINEKTAANGVTIDGLKIKDSGFAIGSDADGDTYYRASGALARLAKGTANQVFRMNSGATAPEWATPSSSGSITVELYENATALDIVKLINDGGTIKAKICEPFAEGTAAEITTNNPTIKYALQIGDDKFVVVYRDDTDSSKGKVVCGTVSGTTITLGAVVTFNNGGNTFQISACKLGTDKFVIAYMDNAATDGNVVVCTISGTTITAGAETNFDATDIDTVSCAQLETDKFVVLWSHASSGTRVICATVSGTTPTFGSAQTVDATNSSPVSNCIQKIYTDKFAVAFLDGTSMTLQCGTVSGTTITLGTAVSYTDGTMTDVVTMPSFETEYMWVIYNNATGVRMMRVAFNSGSTIPLFFPSYELSGTWNFSQTTGGFWALGSGRFVIMDAAIPRIMLGVIGKDGIPIIATVFTPTITGWSNGMFCPLDSHGKVMMTYNDSASDLNTIVFQLGDLNEAVGVLQSSGTAGESKYVAIFGGTSAGHTIAAANYGKMMYAQKDLSVSSVLSPFPIGRAISNTQISIQL